MNERFQHQTDNKEVGSANGDMPESLYGMPVSRVHAGIMREIREAVKNYPKMDINQILEIPGAGRIPAFFLRFAEIQGRALADKAK